MNLWKNNRNIIIKATKWILIIFIALAIILFNKFFDLERVKKIHIEIEKELGEKELNQQLYLFNTQNPLDKFIVTDYPFLEVLPDLKKYFLWGLVQNLDTSSLIFKDESVGYLLSTPSSDSIIDVPVFIETRIKSGEYKEIFNYNGYRFIKIR